MDRQVNVDTEFLKTLRKDGVIQSAVPSFQILTGGVSSEIYRVEDDNKIFVIKRALPKLRVSADWYADVSRNAYEVDYLDYTNNFIPGSIPKVLGRGKGYFVMEFVDGEIQTWKELLLAGVCEPNHARGAGEILGKIHHYSFRDPKAAQAFNSVDNFLQLRIDPYLYHIAKKYPKIAPLIQKEATWLMNTRECLIHGDFSPKNILISPTRMVLVDCEVAFFGNPVFDVAFLVSHLLLKGCRHPNETLQINSLCDHFLSSYKKQRSEQLTNIMQFEMQVAVILLLLLLARIDGKSPVEYLDESKRIFVRDFTLHHISRTPNDLKTLIEEWFEDITQNEN